MTDFQMIYWYRISFVWLRIEFPFCSFNFQHFGRSAALLSMFYFVAKWFWWCTINNENVEQKIVLFSFFELSSISYVDCVRGELSGESCPNKQRGKNGKETERTKKKKIEKKSRSLVCNARNDVWVCVCCLERNRLLTQFRCKASSVRAYLVQIRVKMRSSCYICFCFFLF